MYNNLIDAGVSQEMKTKQHTLAPGEKKDKIFVNPLTLNETVKDYNPTVLSVYMRISVNVVSWVLY